MSLATVEKKSMIITITIRSKKKAITQEMVLYEEIKYKLNYYTQLLLHFITSYSELEFTDIINDIMRAANEQNQNIEAY